MEHENEPQSSNAGKIRVRAHGGRTKIRKPYQRRKTSVPHDDKSQSSQGLMGKVGSLLLPKWISNWFSKTEEAVEGSDSSDDDCDKVERKSQDGPIGTLFQIGNHVGEKTAVSMNNNSLNKQTLFPNNQPLDSSSKEVGGSKYANLSSSDDKKFSSKLFPTPETSDANRITSQFDTMHGSSLTLPLDCNSTFGGSKLSSISVFGTPKPCMTKSSPAFKVSTFVSSKQLSFSSSSASPFYKGRTTFGGASALREIQSKRQKLSPVAAAIHLPKAKVHARLHNRGREKVSGETAKRILRALEKMSTPLQDAKRMSVGLSRAEKTIGKNVTVESRTVLQKQSSGNTESVVLQPTSTSFRPKGLPLSFSPEDCSTTKRPSLKMKRQKTYAHQSSSQKQDNEGESTGLSTALDVTPLVVKSLPKFDFTGTPEHKQRTERDIETVVTKSEEGSIQKSKFLTNSDQNRSKFSFNAPEVKHLPSQESTEVKKSRETFNFSKPVLFVSSAANSVKSLVQTKLVVSSNNSNSTGSSVYSNLFSVGPLIAPRLTPPKGSWECTQCLIKNRPEKEVCAACGNERISVQGCVRMRVTESPTGTKASISEAGTVEKKINTQSDQKNTLSVFAKFAPKQGSWECKTCMIRNSAEFMTCSGCQAVKPSAESAEQQVVTKVTTANSLFAKFAPLPGSWECETCLVRNNADKLICAACSAKKPTRLNEKSKTDTSIFAKFAPKPGSWECPECMIRNDADKETCPACTAAKPSKSSSQIKEKVVETNQSVFAKFAPKPGSWECPECMIRNDADKETCPACTAAKPSSKSDSQIKEKVVETNQSVFAKFAPKPGSWECDTCMVRNAADKTVCCACTTPKGGLNEKEPVKTDISAKEGGPAFKFGLSGGSENQSKFSFGISSGSSLSSFENSKLFDKKEITGTKISFGLKQGTDNITFESDILTDKKDTASKNQPFSFGLKRAFESDSLTDNKEDNDVKSSFSFGVTSSAKSTVSEKASVFTSVGQGNSNNSPVFGSTLNSTSQVTDTSKAPTDITSPQTSHALAPSVFLSTATDSAATKNVLFATTAGNFSFVPIKTTEEGGSADVAPVSTQTLSDSKTVVKGSVFNVTKTAFSFVAPSLSTTNGQSTSVGFASVKNSSSFSKEPPNFAFNSNKEPFTTSTTATNQSLVADTTPSFSLGVTNDKKSTAFSNIAEAAKAGFLQVPNIDEKQDSAPKTLPSTSSSVLNSFIANGPLTGGREENKGLLSAEQTFKFSNNTVAPFFNGGSTQSTAQTTTSIAAPLFSFNKSETPQQSLVTPSSAGNVFVFGMNTSTATQNDKEPKGGFSFLPSTNTNSIFASIPQTKNQPAKVSTQPRFNFGSSNTTAAPFGGFSFTQSSASSTTTAESTFGFSSVTTSALQQPSTGIFTGSQAGRFDFSDSAALKPGGFNFMSSQTKNTNQSSAFGGAFGSQPSLFNVGVGGTNPSVAPVNNRTPGTAPRKLRRATRRLNR